MTVHDAGRSVGRGAWPTLRKLLFVVFNPDRTPPHPAPRWTEPKPRWTGAKSARFFADHGSCATGRVRTRKVDNSQVCRADRDPPISLHDRNTVTAPDRAQVRHELR
jgi:hypothetical protein